MQYHLAGPGCLGRYCVCFPKFFSPLGEKMASHRETDTSLWLHNKLGISTDSWAGGSICSQLNPEVLKNIQECFVELQTQVKLKFLLSFFQFSRRNLEEVSGL